MKRRLNIGCALIHSPKIVIMDEPTVGIDPQSRNHILQSVKKLNESGVTVIYTTHYMEEVEFICNKIAIIDKGKVIAEGTKEELKNIVSDTNKLVISLNYIDKLNLNNLKSIKGVRSVEIVDGKLEITSSKEINNLNEILMELSKEDIEILGIEKKEINLETIFLALTGRKLRD